MKKQVKYDLMSGLLLLMAFSSLCFTAYFVQEKNIDQTPVIEEIDAFPIERTAKRSYTVTCTTYNPTPTQGWGDGLVTFDGSTINVEKLRTCEIRWCAVSHDLAHLIGKTITVGGFGTYEVHDLMHKRHTKRVDLLIHPTHEHFKKENITIEEQ